MTKAELTTATQRAKAETKEAMQFMYDAPTRSEKQNVKDEKVKKLFDRYGVEYSE